MAYFSTRKRRSVFDFEDFGEGKFDGAGAEYAVGGFGEMAGGCRPAGAANGIDDPTDRDANGEVLVEAFHDVAHSVASGEDFDAD